MILASILMSPPLLVAAVSCPSPNHEFEPCVLLQTVSWPVGSKTPSSSILVVIRMQGRELESGGSRFETCLVVCANQKQGLVPATEGSESLLSWI